MPRKGTTQSTQQNAQIKKAQGKDTITLMRENHRSFTRGEVNVMIAGKIGGIPVQLSPQFEIDDLKNGLRFGEGDDLQVRQIHKILETFKFDREPAAKWVYKEKTYGIVYTRDEESDKVTGCKVSEDGILPDSAPLPISESTTNSFYWRISQLVLIAIKSSIPECKYVRSVTSEVKIKANEFDSLKNLTEQMKTLDPDSGEYWALRERVISSLMA